MYGELTVFHVFAVTVTHIRKAHNQKDPEKIQISPLLACIVASIFLITSEADNYCDMVLQLIIVDLFPPQAVLEAEKKLN